MCQTNSGIMPTLFRGQKASATPITLTNISTLSNRANFFNSYKGRKILDVACEVNFKLDDVIHIPIKDIKEKKRW